MERTYAELLKGCEHIRDTAAKHGAYINAIQAYWYWNDNLDFIELPKEANDLWHLMVNRSDEKALALSNGQ